MEEVSVNHPPAHEENYETQDKEHSFGEGRGTPHEVKGQHVQTAPIRSGRA
ncbi:MAG: hypothetical protein KM310_00935 [Clostridiales bacterium]|nr:hypothetical protein [Clostridiales bacterium]